LVYFFLVMLTLFCTLTFGYPALIYLLYKKTKPSKKDPIFQPEVSIIIPTVAGGETMKKKLENIFSLNYPSDRLEVIVVDSSTNRFFVPKGVKVIHQERMGKPAALNKGIEVAKNNIIVMTDDDADLKPNSLTRLVSNFSDPNIGGAVGDLTLGGKGTLNKMNSSFYRVFRNSLRTWQSALDSVSFASGELFAFRKSIVSEIDPKILSDDLYLLFEIRKRGYRVVASDAEVFEEDVPSLRGQINHKRRTMIGTLQVSRKNLKIFFNKQYGLFGTVFAPMYLLRITLCPTLLLIMEVLLVAQFPYLLPFVLASFIMIALLKKDVALALLYGIVTQVAALLGILDFAVGNYGVGWRKKGK